MSEKNQETFMVIAKPKKTLKEKIKWQIETDLFYLCECEHCQIVFLVEEAATNFKDKKHPDRIALKCPVCHTINLIPKGQNRLLLQLKKIMDPDELNPFNVRVAKKMKIEGFDI